MHQKSKYQNLWQSLSVAVLLLSYCAAFLINNLHPLLDHEHHHHTHKNCSTELAEDAHHLPLVQNDRQTTGNSTDHLVSTEHQCKLCDAVLAQFDFPKINFPSLRSFENEHTQFIFNKEKILFRYAHSNHYLRGPPTLS
ncbi:MAG: hypothetical protein AAF573_09560 [Bacteroidota bacterium]